MTTKLAEKRALVSLYQGLNQSVPADLLAQIDALEIDEQRQLQREAAIRSRVQEDLNEIFTQPELVQTQAQPISSPTITEPLAAPAEIIAEAIIEPEPLKPLTLVQRAAALIKEEGVVAPEPTLAQPQKDLEREIRHLREWIGRIAATGPGGGAAQVYNLDMPTKLITTSSYSIGRKDYYIGVNYAGRSFITLPTQNLSSGRDVIIKDESGRCEAFPITVIGNVDNDPDGFILQINNGAIHLIYRDGWRIV